MMKLFKRRVPKQPQNKVELIDNKINLFFNKSIKVIVVGVVLFALFQSVPIALQYFYIKHSLDTVQQQIDQIAIPSETHKAKIVHVISNSKLLVNDNGHKIELEVAPIGDFQPQLKTKFLPGNTIYYSYEKGSNQIRLWNTEHPTTHDELL